MHVPVKYLLECSDRTLGEYQLACLNRASNAKKKARQLNEEVINHMAEAAFALWLREHRRELIDMCTSIAVEAKEVVNLGEGEHGHPLTSADLENRRCADAD